MTFIESRFGNSYNSPKITPYRLVIHAKDSLQKLTRGNTAKQFDNQIAANTDAIAKLENELTSLDTTLNLQYGQTDSVDDIALRFSHEMSNLEGVIAYNLGGRNSLAYKEMFPFGLTDYSNLTRQDTPIKTKRVATVATKYSTELGPKLTATLTAFDADYTKTRDAQTSTFATVDNLKITNTTARQQLEILLTQTTHVVGAIYPGDVAKCSSFFNFNLLYTVGKHKHLILTGKLAPNETKSIINRSFTDNATIIFRNKSTNASYQAWLGLVDNGKPTPDAISLHAGKSSVQTPSNLGDLTNTFLLLNNESGVNEVEYEVEIIG